MMSTIYKLGYDLDHVTALALADQGSSGFFNQFDGRSLADTWVPPAVHPADTSEDDAQLGDCTVLGTVPLLSERGADVLHPIIARTSELLPVRYPRRALFVLNVLEVADCLDEARSKIARFSTGRVMRIDQYVFDSAKLPKTEIFRLSQLPRGLLYVTDRFVGAVQEGGLTGFEFTRLWSS
jgi:hypothetical protein